jgi:hypothetical protein
MQKNISTKSVTGEQFYKTLSRIEEHPGITAKLMQMRPTDTITFSYTDGPVSVISQPSGNSKPTLNFDLVIVTICFKILMFCSDGDGGAKRFTRDLTSRTAILGFEMEDWWRTYLLYNFITDERKGIKRLWTAKHMNRRACFVIFEGEGQEEGDVDEYNRVADAISAGIRRSTRIQERMELAKKALEAKKELEAAAARDKPGKPNVGIDIDSDSDSDFQGLNEEAEIARVIVPLHEDAQRDLAYSSRMPREAFNFVAEEDEPMPGRPTGQERTEIQTAASRFERLTKAMDIVKADEGLFKKEGHPGLFPPWTLPDSVLRQLLSLADMVAKAEVIGTENVNVNFVEALQKHQSGADRHAFLLDKYNRAAAAVATAGEAVDAFDDMAPTGPGGRRRMSEDEAEQVEAAAIKTAVDDFTLQSVATGRRGKYPEYVDAIEYLGYKRRDADEKGRLAINKKVPSFMLTDFQPVDIAAVLQKCDGPFRGVLLSNECGTGKTVEACGAIFFNAKRVEREVAEGKCVECLPCIIVCPPALIDHFHDEMRTKFKGLLHPAILYGSARSASDAGSGHRSAVLSKNKDDENSWARWRDRCIERYKEGDVEVSMHTRTRNTNTTKGFIGFYGSWKRGSRGRSGFHGTQISLRRVPPPPGGVWLVGLGRDLPRGTTNNYANGWVEFSACPYNFIQYRKEEAGQDLCPQGKT